jgi:1-acyl-sn-glycerol-3-phosphate acyltransferase
MALGSVTADLVLLSILFPSFGVRSVVPRVLEAEKDRAVVVCSEHELWIDLLVMSSQSRCSPGQQHTKNHMDAPRPRAATA